MIVNKFKGSNETLHDIGVNVENILNTQNLANSDLGYEIASMISNSSLTLELILTIINNSNGNKIWFVNNISNLPEGVLNGDIVVKSSNYSKQLILSVDGSALEGHYYFESEREVENNAGVLCTGVAGENNAIEDYLTTSYNNITIESPYALADFFKIDIYDYSLFVDGSVNYDSERQLYVLTASVQDILSVINNEETYIQEYFDNYGAAICPCFTTNITSEEYYDDDSSFEAFATQLLESDLVFNVYAVSTSSTQVYCYCDQLKKILTEDDNDSFEPKLTDTKLAAVNSGITNTLVEKYNAYATNKLNALNQNQLNAVNSTITLDKVTKYDNFIDSYLNNIFVIDSLDNIPESIQNGNIVIIQPHSQKQLVETVTSDGVNNNEVLLGFYEETDEYTFYLDPFVVQTNYIEYLKNSDTYESIIIESPYEIYHYFYANPLIDHGNNTTLPYVQINYDESTQIYLFVVDIKSLINDSNNSSILNSDHFYIDPSFVFDGNKEELEEHLSDYDYIYKIYVTNKPKGNIYYYDGNNLVDIINAPKLYEKHNIDGALFDGSYDIPSRIIEIRTASQDRLTQQTTINTDIFPLTLDTLLFAKFINNEPYGYTGSPTVQLQIKDTSGTTVKTLPLKAGSSSFLHWEGFGIFPIIVRETEIQVINGDIIEALTDQLVPFLREYAAAPKWYNIPTNPEEDVTEHFKEDNWKLLCPDLKVDDFVVYDNNIYKVLVFSEDTDNAPSDPGEAPTLLEEPEPPIEPEEPEEPSYEEFLNHYGGDPDEHLEDYFSRGVGEYAPEAPEEPEEPDENDYDDPDEYQSDLELYQLDLAEYLENYAVWEEEYPAYQEAVDWWELVYSEYKQLLSHYYDALTQYNSDLAQYNSDLALYNSDYQAYQASLALYNAWEEAYNTYIEYTPTTSPLFQLLSGLNTESVYTSTLWDTTNQLVSIDNATTFKFLDIDFADATKHVPAISDGGNASEVNDDQKYYINSSIYAQSILNNVTGTYVNQSRNTCISNVFNAILLILANCNNDTKFLIKFKGKICEATYTRNYIVNKYHNQYSYWSYDNALSSVNDHYRYSERHYNLAMLGLAELSVLKVKSGNNIYCLYPADLEYGIRGLLLVEETSGLDDVKVLENSNVINHILNSYYTAEQYLHYGLEEEEISLQKGDIIRIDGFYAKPASNVAIFVKLIDGEVLPSYMYLPEYNNGYWIYIEDDCTIYRPLINNLINGTTAAENVSYNLPYVASFTVYRTNFIKDEFLESINKYKWTTYNSMDNLPTAINGTEWFTNTTGPGYDANNYGIGGYIDVDITKGNTKYDLRNLPSIETNVIITFRDIIPYETIIYYRGVDNIRLECISPLTSNDFYFANEPPQLDSSKMYAIHIKDNVISYETLTKNTSLITLITP